MPTWIVIQFTRDISFPRFSMQKGETWTLGTEASRRAYLDDGETFAFAGGQCPRSAVRELYRGDDRAQAHEIEQSAVMAGPNTMQRRAHVQAAGETAHIRAAHA